MTLAGLRKPYTFDTIGEIPGLWHEFGPKMHEVPNAVDGTTAYGVSIMNGNENGFDYMAAVEVQTGAAGSGEFEILEVPAQRYAVFPHEGHVSQLCVTIDKAFKGWIPDSGLQPTLNPLVLEHYGPGFNPQTGTGDLEVWLPIKS